MEIRVFLRDDSKLKDKSNGFIEIYSYSEDDFKYISEVLKRLKIAFFLNTDNELYVNCNQITFFDFSERLD